MTRGGGGGGNFRFSATELCADFARGRACTSTMYSECHGASEEGGSQLEIGSESPGSSSVHDPRLETTDHVASRHPGPTPGGQCSTSLEAATRPEGMSKNQWKKLLKEQRRKEERKEWK